MLLSRHLKMLLSRHLTFENVTFSPLSRSFVISPTELITKEQKIEEGLTELLPFDCFSIVQILASGTLYF